MLCAAEQGLSLRCAARVRRLAAVKEFGSAWWTVGSARRKPGLDGGAVSQSSGGDGAEEYSSRSQGAVAAYHCSGRIPSSRDRLVGEQRPACQGSHCLDTESYGILGVWLIPPHQAGPGAGPPRTSGW